MQLIHGDCLDALRTLPDRSVDAVVTDPPAGIAFMGKAWDGDKGGRDLWIAWLAERLAECLRVLKPGGHAVVWALPRTSGWTHRALEDAGFDVRDCVHHLFGSGFPKSLDVGKAIDKQRCDNPDWRAVGTWLRSARLSAGISAKGLCAVIGAHGDVNHGGAVSNWENGFNCPTWDQWAAMKEVLGLGDEMDAEVWRLNGRKGTPGEAWELREVVGSGKSGPAAVAFTRSCATEYDVTASATPAAQQWDGWGTALKPAVEHWWLARKPLDSTVAGNVTRWGTGALNIDGCRVESGPPRTTHANGHRSTGSGDGYGMSAYEAEVPAGRWPADVVLSHTAECNGVCSPGCAVAELDRQSGTTKDGVAVRRNGAGMGYHGVKEKRPDTDLGYGGSGGASRFFPAFKYQAKPSGREKSAGLDDRNHHSTVKPVELMRWLARLVTPPGGVILDPFAGSGTTGVAATLERFDSILIEAEAEYLPLIEGRVRWAEQQTEPQPLPFD